MKKLFLLLLLATVFGYGQTYPSPQYNVTTTNTLKIKTPATVTSVNFLSTVETDGSIAKIGPFNLPFSLKENFINIKDLGGLGDGVFDNTTIVNNALATYKEVYFPDGNYIVTSLVNDFGSKITGPGLILKPITGGDQQLNTGIDRFNYVFGQEYLSFVQKKILTPVEKSTSLIRIIWSGDSTTAGDATTAGYPPSDLFLFTARKNSISSVTSLNRGHSGENTEQWRTTRLASDLAENPDLYIIRWGINDASRGISAFRTSLRTGLATIRASKTQAQMSIILMSPNSTSDTPNGRDEKWYEQVRLVYIEAARDYKCAFIDTYSLWLDSRGAANVYMDDPYGDGRAIHPFDVFNTWIVSKVFGLVFPESLKAKLSSGFLMNQSSADRIPSFSDLPESYQKGITLNRVTSGWAVDGTALTLFNTDGSGMQLNSSRMTSVPELYFRSFIGTFSTETLSWSNNNRIWHSGNLTPNTGEGVSGQVTFWNGTNTQTGSSGLTWDNSSKQLIVSDGTVSTQVYSTLEYNGGFMGTISNHPLTFQTNSTGKVTIKTNGDVTVYNLAGTGTRQVVADASGNLSATVSAPTSGTYTPTVSGIANTTTAVLAGNPTYTRVGNVVTVTVGIQTTIPAITTQSQITITLPINRTITTTQYVGSGSLTNNSSPPSTLTANIPVGVTINSGSTTTATCYFNPTSTLNTWIGSVTFQYSIN